MKSFVDKLGWYRWVNSTGWSTQDIEAIVNEIADSFSPHAVAGGVPARQFRRGIRMISIRETSAGENRMNGPMGRYSELRDSSMKGVVSAASWSDATISILTRDRWYDSDVQALAVMTDKGHAPPHVVRQLASVIYPVFRDAIPMTDYELHRGLQPQTSTSCRSGARSTGWRTESQTSTLLSGSEATVSPPSGPCTRTRRTRRCTPCSTERLGSSETASECP